MRRLPRPSRVIDPASCLQYSTRQRIAPSPCRAAVASCTHIRTSTAAFSTTPSNAFLLPGGKQDKKKHQQFVRRWQKRLLGDSEPIGAHVDPYDPTSPVRIAPEDQGEYEEVLDEDGRVLGPLKYVPAEDLGVDRPGARLMHVGGEEWLSQKKEGDLAKEFEKLTMRTYTPLSLDMANEIEELTGTPYTLRDENLMMAQIVHEVTGRPYTKYNYGLYSKVNKPEELRKRFAQAVAEVYALKEAGLDMDVSKFNNRGIYRSPRWVKDIKLYKTDSGELALAYPAYKSAEHFIQVMQRAPEWESNESIEEDVLLDEAADLLDPVLPQDPVPTMDPATPEFKREAVVKVDPEKKPFDFMSNRPTPRKVAAEAPTVEEAIVVEHATQEPETPATLPAVKSKSRHSELEQRAQRLADEFTSLKRETQSKSASSVEEVKWRHIPITDVALKFALFKRVLQLTGIRISDPNISSAATLGDLYGELCAAAKPQPKSLFSAIHIEAQKAQERKKQIASTTQTSQRRADLGDLINLGNVEVHRVKPTKTDKRTKTGMEKVVSYALWERGLGPIRRQRRSTGATPFAGVVEGTRRVPAYGKPLPSKAASLLAKKTRENAEVKAL